MKSVASKKLYDILYRHYVEMREVIDYDRGIIQSQPKL